MGTVLLECPDCGARNRLPLDRVRSRPTCGRCDGALPVDARPLDLDHAAWESLVLRSAFPVVVGFWAKWSKPSTRFMPAIAKLAEAQAGRLRVVRVDVERERELVERYEVTTLPTVLVLIDGEEVARKTGKMGPADLELFAIHSAGLLAA